MRDLKYWIVGSLLMINGFVLKAQESLPFYNHYLMSDNYLMNPSYAGVNPDIIKLTATHHAQWTGVKDAPSTQTFSAHARLSDRFSGGMYVYRDTNGASQMTGLNISGAYHIPIGDQYNDSFYPGEQENVFSFGLSYHGFNQSFDVSKWNPQTWNDPLLVNTSSFHHYFNVGTSFYYNGIFAGISVLDLPLGDNDPVINVIEPLPTWYYLNGGYQFFVTENIQLTPSFLFAVNGQSDRKIDATMRAKLYSGDNAFGFGINYRTAVDQSGLTTSGISPMVDLTIRKIRVGYSYQIALSDIGGEVGGGHLLSLGFDLTNPWGGDY